MKMSGGWLWMGTVIRGMIVCQDKKTSFIITVDDWAPLTTSSILKKTKLPMESFMLNGDQFATQISRWRRRIHSFKKYSYNPNTPQHRNSLPELKGSRSNNLDWREEEQYICNDSARRFIHCSDNKRVSFKDMVQDKDGNVLYQQLTETGILKCQFTNKNELRGSPNILPKYTC
jgi:predicted acyl esterase